MLSSNRYLTFSRGLRDGLPIALGYISVAFAFGILAVEKGLPAWSPILISVTNFTGTGQFAGIDLIAAMASFAEIAFTLLIINLRYLLMSLSLSQRLEPGIGLGKRMAIAFGITDEIFAVAIQKESLLGGKYLAGLILSSYSGWVGGTVLGALASSLLPASLLSALGIALYAMFIAIIIPPGPEQPPGRPRHPHSRVPELSFPLCPLPLRAQLGMGHHHQRAGLRPHRHLPLSHAGRQRRGGG